MKKLTLKRYIEVLAPKFASKSACEIIESYQKDSTEKDRFYFTNAAVDFLRAVLNIVICDYATPFDEDGNELKPVVTKGNCIIPFAYDKENDIVEPFTWAPKYTNQDVADVLNKPLDEIISIIKEQNVIGCDNIIKAFDCKAIEQLQMVVYFLKDIYKNEA